MAGLASITCVVHEGSLDDGERLALQVVENALREDLRPIEQARAYKRLLDLNGWSTRQLATELNLAASTVSKALALLELPEPVQDQVEQGGLAPSAAYQIAQIPDPAVQAELAKRAVAEKLTYGQVEAVVRAKKAGTTEPRQRPARFEFESDMGRVVASPRRHQDLIALLRAALVQAEAQIVAETSDEVQAA
jgi:ParB family chromosome partitioning protein